MLHTRHMMTAATACLLFAGWVQARSGAPEAGPAATTPPDSFFGKVRERDRDAARGFYTKYVDVKGVPVVASAEVADLALQRTWEIVTHMLAGRPDVLQAMVDRGMYLTVQDLTEDW